MKLQTLLDDFDETSFHSQCDLDGVTHITTGVAVIHENKLLLVRRVADDDLGGIYELPGGGVDEGESIVEGAFRELQEETGITTLQPLFTFIGFDYETPRKPHARQVNICGTVKDSTVLLDPAEHDAYVWVDIQQALKLVSDDKHMTRSIKDLFVKLKG